MLIASLLASSYSSAISCSNSSILLLLLSLCINLAGCNSKEETTDEVITEDEIVIDEEKSLDEVLREMKLKGYTLPDDPEKLVYNELSEDISTDIINDAVKNINSWGLEFPEVSHHFSDDPNDNYSSPAKMVKGNEIPDVLKMNHN